MIIFVFKSIHQKCTNDMNCKKTIYQYAIILNVKKIDRCIDSIYELKPFKGTLHEIWSGTYVKSTEVYKKWHKFHFKFRAGSLKICHAFISSNISGYKEYFS